MASTKERMCALAGLPARAAARVRALEAGAPALPRAHCVWKTCWVQRAC